MQRLMPIGFKRGLILTLSVAWVCAESIGAPVSVPAGQDDQVAKELKERVDAALNKTLPQSDTLNKEAFSQVPNSLFALSSDQIHDLRRLYNDNQRAGAFTGDQPSRPTSSTIPVDLTPGATPPVIRLAAGYVSSLLFYDESGAPWPISAYNIGNPAIFNINFPRSTLDTEKTGENMGNALLVQSNSQYRDGNIAVMLRGLNTPIMLTFMPGQRAVDYRTDIKIPRRGPYAQANANQLPAPANHLLLDLVNGIAPKTATKLEVDQSGLQAWSMGKKMFVRTTFTLLSPSWESTMSSADGSVHTYEMKPVSTLLASNNGRTVQFKVKGFHYG